MQAHGLKNHSLPYQLQALEFVGEDNRVDIGITKSTSTITLLCRGGYRTYPLFNTTFGTLRGIFEGLNFKVYSTLVHHLKKCCGHFLRLPSTAKSNKNIRDSAKNIEEFLEDFKSAPYPLGLRYEVSFVGDNCWQLKECQETLARLEEHLTPCQIKEVTVEEYVRGVS